MNTYFIVLSRLLAIVAVVGQMACGLGQSSGVGSDLSDSTVQSGINPKCASLSDDKCAGRSDCKLLTRPLGVKACFDKAELGKPCGEITVKANCELPGYSNEACVYFQRRCKAKSDFDVRGFDAVTRRHMRDEGNDYFDDRSFDINGLYRDGTPRDGDGFDVSGRDMWGFDANGKQPNGLDVDASGFNVHGIHHVTNLPRSSPPSQLRELEVGKLCYIPGPGDYLARPDVISSLRYFPNTYENAQAFVRAIEDKCKEYLGNIDLAPGQTKKEKRETLIVDLSRALQRAPGGNSVTINREDGYLKTYVNLINGLHGAGRFFPVSRVRFQGEVGFDAGGPRREYKDLVAQELGKLFKAEDGEEHMRFDDTFVDFAKCTAAPQLADAEHCWLNAGATFAKLVFYDELGMPYAKLSYYLRNKLLGKSIASFVDYLALLKLDNPSLFQTSVINILKLEEFGMMDFFDVTEGVDDRDVDPSNVLEYVEVTTKKQLTHKYDKHFIDGFLSVITKETGESIFHDRNDLNASTLGLILGGNEVSFAAVKDLIDVTTGTNSDQMKQWILEIIEEKSNEDPEFLHKLLRFWSGPGTLPSGNQRLKIQLGYADSERLPEGHTCFYQIDMPNYRSKEKTKDKFIRAVEGAADFDLY